MLCETGAPLTVNEPEYGDGEYILSDVCTVNEYVPLASENEYDVDVIAPESTPVLKFTYQVIPEPRPVSVNVTVYVAGVEDVDEFRKNTGSSGIVAGL